MTFVDPRTTLTSIAIYSLESGCYLGKLRLIALQETPPFEREHLAERPDTPQFFKFSWQATENEGKSGQTFETVPPFLSEFCEGFAGDARTIFSYMVNQQATHSTHLALLPCDPWEQPEQQLSRQIERHIAKNSQLPNELSWLYESINREFKVAS